MSVRTWTAIKSVKLDAPGLDGLDVHALERMLEAGEEVLECQRVLEKGGANIVGEVLREQGEFIEFDHYPKGDVFDDDTHAQYYYHAHRGLPGEHGHFHTFMRSGGIPADTQPVRYEGEAAWPTGDDEVVHLGAVSMDRFGFPIGFFATNRWVTDEAWYAGPDVMRMIDGFEMDHAWPSWPTNRWLGAMVRLFRPELEVLMLHRDRIVDAWRSQHPDRDVFEDRELEITGQIRIYVKDRVALLRDRLG